MKRTGFATVLVALLVVLAGCAGGAGTLTDSPQSNDATGTASSGSGTASETGTVNFYVSDEENAIEDFEHLNVTIERVTFVRAESGDDSPEAEDESENDSDEEAADVDEEANVSAEANATANETANATANATVTANATANASANTTATTENESEVEADDDADADAVADAEEDSKDDLESDASGQVTYEVENVTVDLTELKGDNASLVDAYDVPKGDYNAVHIEVSNVSGTLKSGEQVNLKLPSNKLKLNSGFTVEKGGSTDFVFDITAFEAGNSGKYILKPVISESGTNVKISKVGDDHDESDEMDAEDEHEEDANDAEAEHENTTDDSENESDDAEMNANTELNVTLDGNLTAGENVTLTVTQNGSAVENATVTVDDEEVGTTDADGTLVVELPHVKEMDLKVTHGDAEAEYEFDLTVVVTETGGNDSKKPDSPGKSDNDDA